MAKISRCLPVDEPAAIEPAGALLRVILIGIGDPSLRNGLPCALRVQRGRSAAREND
jgi:hypothetical protein